MWETQESQKHQNPGALVGCELMRVRRGEEEHGPFASGWRKRLGAILFPGYGFTGAQSLGNDTVLSCKANGSEIFLSGYRQPEVTRMEAKQRCKLDSLPGGLGRPRAIRCVECLLCARLFDGGFGDLLSISPQNSSMDAFSSLVDDVWESTDFKWPDGCLIASWRASMTHRLPDG